MTQKVLASGKSSMWNKIPGFRQGGVFPVLLILLIVIIGFSLIKYYLGAANSLGWVLVSNTDPSTISFDQFNIGLFSFDIPADNYLVWQSFLPTDISVDYTYFYVFLVAMAIGLAAFQTTYSRMSRYPFILCSVAFILLFNMIHIEETMMFGVVGRVPVFILIGVNVLVAFLFNSFLKSTSASARFLIFLTIHLITAFLIHQYSVLKDPLITITPYAFLSASVLAVLFILLVSQEVIFAILQLTTRPTLSATSNGKHFLILGAIYIINLLLLYLRNAGIILTELAIIDEYWILIISTIVAFFTIREKNVLFPSYPFNPYAHLLLSGLGILTFVLLLFQFVITNNPAIDAFKDLISYVHLGFGFMFYAYIILNFLAALYKSVPVYKIVYKEINFPFVTSLLAGLAIFAGVFFYSDKKPYFEIYGAYFNIHGDAQQALKDFSLAESYYKGAGLYGGNNQKSFYHLASLAKYDGRDDDQEYYLDRALKKRPSEHVYVALADFYKKNGDFFKALFTLRDGLDRFPESAFLRNNLAMQYAKTNVLDSAIYYFNADYYTAEWKGVSKTNNWFIYARSNQEFPADSVNELLKASKVPFTNNLIAYANLKNQSMDMRSVAIPKDSILNSHSFPLLNNMTLNSGEFNTDSLAAAMDAAAQHPFNGDLKHFIDYDLALLKYSNQNYNGFLRSMDAAQVGANETEKGEYLNTIGLVALKLNAPRLAVDYFGSALQQNFEDAKVNYGVALNEAFLIDDAKKYWNALLNRAEDSVHHPIAYNQSTLLNLSVDEVLAAPNDAIKYQYLRVFGRQLRFDDFIKIHSSITNNNMRADLLIAYIDDELADNKSDRLTTLLSELNQVQIQSPKLETMKRDIEILSAIRLDDLGQLKAIIENGGASVLERWPFLNLYKDGLDSVKQASLYQQEALKNPFNIPVVFKSVSFFDQQGNEEISYEILLNAVEINPYSLPLLKAFAFSAIDQYLIEFADDVLPRIEALSTSTEYRQFLQAYESRKKEVEEEEIW
ncbi:MAG: hypothetical protein AAFQ94_08295 [Bacteroidota bacterium]